MTKTTFPDKKFLRRLALHMRDKADARQNMPERLTTSCGVLLNWVADYITDPSIQWTKEKLSIDNLWLTGTNPEWNKIIVEKCQRSPQKLKQLLKKEPAIANIFSKSNLEKHNKKEAEVLLRDKKMPILIRYEENKYKVLNGMYRTILAILDEKNHINAFVARAQNKFQPQCEPHVVYDLLRSYNRGINKDKQGLIAALYFLKNSYSNVENLLKTRFSKPYIPGNDEIQDIIYKALKRNTTKNLR